MALFNHYIVFTSFCVQSVILTSKYVMRSITMLRSTVSIFAIKYFITINLHFSNMSYAHLSLLAKLKRRFIFCAYLDAV